MVNKSSFFRSCFEKNSLVVFLFLFAGMRALGELFINKTIGGVLVIVRRTL